MNSKPLEITGETERSCKICHGKIAPRGNSKYLCRKCYNKDYRKRNPNIYAREKAYENKKRKDAVRLRRGIPLDTPNLTAPRGSGHLNEHGYKCICIKDHPNCKNKKGRIYEHVFVMSKYLGRPLNKGESVHHKNGIRHDNRIENLELWNKSHPPGQRVEDKIEWCKEFLIQYGFEILKKE
jgi:hypothetical protein